MSINKNGIGRRSFLKTGAAAAELGLLADLEVYPQNVNRSSNPSDLKITDMRIAVLRGPGGKAAREGAGGVTSFGGSGGVGGARGFGGPPRGPMPPATPGAGAASGGTIIVRID